MNADLLADVWDDLAASLDAGQAAVLTFLVARQAETPDTPFLCVNQCCHFVAALEALVDAGLVARIGALPLYVVLTDACRARARAYRAVEGVEA